MARTHIPPEESPDNTIRAQSSTRKKIAIMILIVSAGFFTVRVIPYMRRPTGGFLAEYYAGRMLLTHENMSLLYDTKQFEEITRTRSGLPFGENYTANTPVLPFVLLPFSVLPIADSKMVWELFSLVCLAAALGVLYRHLRLDSLEGILMTALVFGFTPVYMNFVWGQVYAFLFLLHALALRFWAAGRIVAASASIALLVSIKGYGVFFLVLAVFRKEWLLLLYTLLMVVCIVAVSSLVIGIQTWLAYGSQLTRFLSAVPASATFQQTIGSFFSWFLARDHWHPLAWFDLPYLVRPLMALSLAGGLFLLKRSSRNGRRSSLDLSFAIAIILGVLTAPLLFDYHYLLLLIPVLVCYKHLSGLVWRAGAAAFAIVLLLLALKLPYYDPPFQTTWLGVLGFPRVFGALLLVGLLSALAARVRSGPGREFSQAGPATIAVNTFPMERDR